MLEVKKIYKNFGGIKALNDCSFIIKKGIITGLIGPNGSGKSTIFNLISGIIRPDKGKIIFDKYDITKKSSEDISNLGVSRVFQKSKLFDNLTVKDNLLLAFDNNDTKFWRNFFKIRYVDNKKNKTIKKLLQSVELFESLNKQVKDLSYGQKRLIELIRAIINPHSFLILDEPVAGVNPNLKQKIKKILLDLKSEGETILIIEHDMNFIFDIADKIIVMDEGAVIAIDKPDKIKKNKLVREAYLG